MYALFTSLVFFLSLEFSATVPLQRYKGSQRDVIYRSNEMPRHYKDVIPNMNKRGATSDPSYLWPNARIPYLITPGVAKHSSAIRRAMDQWQKNTCIKFVPRTTETVYLEIMKLFDTCAATVGYADEADSNFMYLSNGCYGVDYILHELGHVLGFHHEQSRPDRDNYVRIIEKNIIDGYEYQFEIEPNIDSRNVSYDFTSIMHYGPRAFSKGGNTIEPIDPRVVLKENKKLSSSDKKQANLMYKCKNYSG